MSETQRPSPTELAELLLAGSLEVVGRIPWSSNATLLVEVTRGEHSRRAIYKPVRGERPLWDFPEGLHKRELAAYLLADRLGWPKVPPTVIRSDAPFGEGSIQLVVEPLQETHYLGLGEQQHRALAEKIHEIAVFDFIVNNADRKSGHVLFDENNQVWAIDHGLCFHAEPKLRTVIWDFVDVPIPQHLIDALGTLESSHVLGVTVSSDELRRLDERVERLCTRGSLPSPESEPSWPWPLV